MYERSILGTLRVRFTEPRRFIQALVGPRQVGKTTIARQLIQSLSYPAHCPVDTAGRQTRVASPGICSCL